MSLSLAPPNHFRKWTHEDKEKLLRLSHKDAGKTRQDVAQELGRSEGAILCKLIDLVIFKYDHKPSSEEFKDYSISQEDIDEYNERKERQTQYYKQYQLTRRLARKVKKQEMTMEEAGAECSDPSLLVKMVEGMKDPVVFNYIKKEMKSKIKIAFHTDPEADDKTFDRIKSESGWTLPYLSSEFDSIRQKVLGEIAAKRAAAKPSVQPKVKSKTKTKQNKADKQPASDSPKQSQEPNKASKTRTNTLYNLINNKAQSLVKDIEKYRESGENIPHVREILLAVCRSLE